MMVFEGRAPGRWLGHESKAPIHVISGLIKETPVSSFAPLGTWGHSPLRTRRWVLARHQICQGLERGLTRTWEIMLLFISHPAYGNFVIESQVDSDVPWCARTQWSWCCACGSSTCRAQGCVVVSMENRHGRLGFIIKHYMSMKVTPI